MCVSKCPQNIIKIMLASQKIFVRCSIYFSPSSFIFIAPTVNNPTETTLTNDFTPPVN
ncbi:MAG: hypothetical protein JJE17_10555 [Peptostreptococcaceae bacterium]|nr:hypothetical protein [Peptostreptococcaceae bacterium]